MKRKNYFFALGYIPHRLWGGILIAQLLEKDEVSMYYVTGEILLKNPDSLSYQRLTPMQKEVVNIIDEYNDKVLHRLFSKKRTVKEFQDSVDNSFIEDHIRPYIETRIYRALKIAAENKFRVFIKEKTSQNIFNDDFLNLHKKPVKPYFRFRKLDDHTSYRLSVLRGADPVDLVHDRAEVICNTPAAVLLERDIYFVSEIDARKLTPFFTKEQVLIQKNFEEKYFRSFIAKTIRDHDEVETIGFSITDIEPERSVVLSLETGIAETPVWIVKLQYNNFSLSPGSRQQRFVNFNKQSDEFSFERFSRDPEWEEQLEIALEEIGLKSRDRTVYTLRKWSGNTKEEKVFEAVKYTNDNFEFLKEAGFQLQQKLDRNYSLRNVELSMGSEEKSDWFDLRATVRFGEFSFPFTKLRKHILDGERLYELPDGTFAVIPEEWFASYKSVFEFGQVDGDILKIHKQHFSQVDEAIRKKHSGTIEILEKLTRLEELTDIALPRGLEANLRDYQVEGFAWMWLLQESGFGGCLADDMGLGKTLQAIAVIQNNKEKHLLSTNQDTPEKGQLNLFNNGSENGTLTNLVVVPASLTRNWNNEINRFAPSLKVFVHAGINRNRNTDEFKYYDVVVSSYHTVRQDIEFIRDYSFHYIILDESQMIKNPHSKLYRAMTELEGTHKLVLTGTPIENSLTDLWSQINFVNEGLLGSLNFFKKQFVKSIEKKKNKGQEDRLKELIRPFVLRRTKQEVAKELPMLYEQHRFCDMTDDQKRLYEEEKSMVRNELLENLEEVGLERSTMMVLKALTRLRQLSNHPSMVETNYEGGSGKYDEVFRDIESVVMEDHKVLIFSSFVKHIDLYAEKLDELGWRYARLTGSTRNRHEQVEKFQEDPECRIFLISLKAGGTGLNLTAAEYVFILDPWWNPAAEMQALNRAHRIGQDKNVFVYRFISNDTVEQKIVRLQERKTELAKTFITSNNPLRNMKKEEILELFN